MATFLFITSERFIRTATIVLVSLFFIPALGAEDELKSALNPRSAWDGAGPTPAYVSQKWPETRTLTWANPGTSGDFSDPENWLESGATALTVPDETTDVILPSAETSYSVSSARQKVRHVDIGQNAELIGTHRAEIEIWGNCWIHDGGYAMFIAIRGDRHAFLKNENAEFPSVANGLPYRGPKSKGGTQNATQVSHKFQICKYGTASIEILGKFGVGDEIMLQHGRLILNGELRWSGYTGKGALEVYDGGILELQSGSRIVPFMPTNMKAIYNIDLYRNAMLQAGSPERPLTADAEVILGFAVNDVPGRTGLYAAKGSMIRVYSSDPQKYKLRFGSTVEVSDYHNARGVPIEPEATQAEGKLGTALQLAGDVQLDGVHFDYLSQGGIAVAETVDPETWDHVSFGEHNAASGRDLFSAMKVDDEVYYHTRNDGASELALVNRAILDMKSYLAETDSFQLKAFPESSTLEKVNVDSGKRSEEQLVPKSVVFRVPVSVTVECSVNGARMRYTLDGTEPSKDAPVYTGPIELTETTKLMVKAYKSGLGFSPTLSAVYVIE